jgi:cytochrome c oxidase subunit 3
MRNKNILSLKSIHSFHLVDNSPWPFFVSIYLLNLIISLICGIYNKIAHNQLILWSMISLLLSILFWINEIILEGTYKGDHTKSVKLNLMTGFILFVISEISIFISLFFGYFYNSLIPSIEIGTEWPPIGINILNPESIPLFNTALLYFSGICITISQNYLYKRDKSFSLYFLFLTIMLGLLFSYIQYLEYMWAFYTINDSIYSTTFYMLTGFHGLHVIIGTILLIVSLIRLYLNHFIYNHHIGFTSSGIYWHFVDYIWLILYGSLYCWGS